MRNWLVRSGRHFSAAAAAAALMMSASTLAQSGGQTLRLEDVPWPSARAGAAGTSGASGIETVVLKGDPTKAGLYTLMLRVAPNVRIQAHSHKDDRVATVVRGTWYFSYGEKFDEASLKALGPGSFYTEPPGVAHFAMTKEEVILQISGHGPSSTTYVDAANDPSRR